MPQLSRQQFKEQKQIHFIHKPDEWYIDLMFLTDDFYNEHEIPDSIITVYYNPAFHILYMIRVKDKNSTTLADTIPMFLQYIKQLTSSNTQYFCDTIISDDGSEFKGAYQKALKEYDIEHNIIIKNLEEHKELAPINGIMKWCRNIIIKAYAQIADSILMNEDGTKSKNRINENALVDVLDEAIKQACEYHNKQHEIKIYHKMPVDITREDIYNLNEAKQFYNQKVTEKTAVHLNDVVRVMLKHKPNEKARQQKWSDGIYRVVGVERNTVYVIPLNFDIKQYRDSLDETDDTYAYSSNLPMNMPIYRRQIYEVKLCDSSNQTVQMYNAYELEPTRFYAFTKITDALVKNKNNTFTSVDNLQQFTALDDSHAFYEVIQEGQTYYVPQKFLYTSRMNDSLSPAEQDFWFYFQSPNFSKYVLYF